MFLHIKSLLHKIHPYFSQYGAYLRNMRISKKEAIESLKLKLKLKLELLLYDPWDGVQCIPRGLPSQFQTLVCLLHSFLVAQEN